MCIRSCHEDLILTRKSHNCAGITFIQGNSADGSKLIDFTCKLQKMLSQPKVNLFCVFGRIEQMRILRLKQAESENKYLRYIWLIYFVSERKKYKTWHFASILANII